MEKRWNKKGQFYLIAAIVIIAVLFGLANTTNFSKKRIPLRIENIEEDLEIESQKVLDYILHEGADKTIVMNDFAKLFDDYSGGDTEIYYIMINGSDESAYYFNDTGTTFIPLERGENEANITIAGTRHTFTLTPGDNFYFAMVKEIGGEKYISTNFQ